MSSGDMRDNLQPSMDSWEMRRPDNNEGEWKGRKKKVCVQNTTGYLGREAGAKPSKTSLQPPPAQANLRGHPRPISKLVLRPSSQRKQL